MPIRKQIEAVVQQLTGSPTFVYGTPHEINEQLYHLKSSDYPAVIMLAEMGIDLKFSLSNAMNDSHDIFLAFVYKTAEAPDTSINQEPLVQQSLALCKEFLVKLSHYRWQSADGGNGGRYFKIKARQEGRFVPMYNAYDANTAGGRISLKLQTMYADNVIVPA